MATLLKEAPKLDDTIHVDEMVDGQGGLAVSWYCNARTGQLVQRNGAALTVIGSDCHRSTYFLSPSNALNRVRILPAGSIIKL